MEIKRTAFGTETTIALTNEELERAAKEYLWNTARREVVRQIDDWEEYENVTADLIDTITSEFREKMDGTTYDETLLAVIHQHDDELEEFKQKFHCFSVRVEQVKSRYYTIRAKDEDEAESILKWRVENNEDGMSDDFEYEDAEYDWNCIDPDDYTSPEDAELRGDDL